MASTTVDLERLIAAEIVTARLRGESFYFEMTCQRVNYDDDGKITWACNQRFKFPRGIGSSVMCPKCYCTQNMSSPDLQQAICAIPVD